jgi:uncharacterized protein YggE
VPIPFQHARPATKVTALGASLLVTAGLVALAMLAIRPAAAPAAPAVVAAQTPGPLVPFLRFSATGTVTVSPDRATLGFTTDATAPSQSQAMNAASERMRRLIGALRGAGIDAQDLQTSNVAVSRDWQHPQQDTATQNLTVTVRDPKRAGQLLALGADNGATASSGPSFSLADSSTFYAAALRRALQEARGKADAAAAQMGVRITGVVSVDEGPTSTPPWPVGADQTGPRSATTPPPIQPGSQQVSATVTVVFSYKPR